MTPRPEDAGVGLCARCRYAQRQRSAKGSEFWRCLRADELPWLLRYPPLPVRACQAFQDDTDAD